MGKNIHNNSLPRKIFDELLCVWDEAMLTATNPTGVLWSGGVGGYLEKQRARKDFAEAEERRKIRQAINRLQEQNLIRIQKKGEEVYFNLTEKGLAEKLKTSIRSTNEKMPNKGKCYVSFDIPEHVREIRVAIRRMLKDCHFVMIHHSLWCTDKDVGDDVTAFVKSLKADRWIHVFVGNSRT